MNERADVRHRQIPDEPLGWLESHIKAMPRQRGTWEVGRVDEGKIPNPLPNGIKSLARQRCSTNLRTHRRFESCTSHTVAKTSQQTIQ